MDSPHTGSDELIYVQTDKVSVTIKGRAVHPSFQDAEWPDQDSTLKVSCNDPFALSLREQELDGFEYSGNMRYCRSCTTAPIFYEQQRYELVIEAEGDHTVSFWHDNLNIRNKITKVGRSSRILSGVINFGNEIGYSDLVIRVDGRDYLQLVIEVFPSKISYREDYQAIVEDVTREVYNLVFDFLKKAYLGYQQGDRTNSSPVEFFAVIRHIYEDFLRAADLILAKPHHILETTHEVIPAHKVKRIDNRSLRWIEKHPDHARICGQNITVDRTLAMRKQVTYDTKENRLTKYILQSTARKLQNIRKSYRNLKRQEDGAILQEIDGMIANLNRRSSASFLADVGAHEASSGMSLVFSEYFTRMIPTIHGSVPPVHGMIPAM